MNKSDLEQWVLDDFWPAYSGLVKTPFPTKYKAGNRGEAIKKILILDPSSELRKRMIDAIAAQMSHRRTLFSKLGSMQKYNIETHKIKFYCNRNGATWIYNYGWDDEIPPLVSNEVKYSETTQECRTPGCTKNAIGGNIPVCQDCECKAHDVYREEKREHLKKIGLTMTNGESLSCYAIRCKEFTLKNPVNLKNK